MIPVVIEQTKSRRTPVCHLLTSSYDRIIMLDWTSRRQYGKLNIAQLLWMPQDSTKDIYLYVNTLEVLYQLV